MRNQNTNHQVRRCVEIESIDTSLKGRTRTAFGNMPGSRLSLFGFRCDFILLSMAERDRQEWRELTRQSFETKTDDTGARYVRKIWSCVLIIMIIK